MPTLLKEDLDWCVYRLKESVREVIRTNPNRIFVAGGFIRSCVSGDKINDIDLFVPDHETAERMARHIASVEGKRIRETGNAFTVKTMPYATQFIHRWTFTDPVECIQSFDFTIAKAAIWFDGTEWKSACDDRFYADLAAKRLTYCSPVRDEEAGGSMLRVLKFYQRGFKVDMNSLGAVINRIATRALDMIPEEAEGVDMTPIITGLLKEVDPDIDPEHRSHLPAQSEESHHVLPGSHIMDAADYVNAAACNEQYQAVNPPITINF